MRILDRKKRFVWCDLETFGLDSESDPILEVGFKVTDLNLNVVDQMSILVWDMAFYGTRFAKLQADAANLPDESEEGRNARFVLEMHNSSGLWDDVRRRGTRPLEAERIVNEWLQQHRILGGSDPLCGSSVQFDRGMLEAQMPTIARRFSHRNIDVSTIKELCLRFNPKMYAHLGEDVLTNKSHRVLDDLDDTIAELNWYADNFLFIDPEALLEE